MSTENSKTGWDEVSKRWSEEIKKGGKFELLAQDIDGDVVIGVFRSDLPGLNQDLINYVELVRLQAGSVSLLFDDQDMPIVMKGVKSISPEEVARMEKLVEVHISEYLQEYPDKKLGEELVGSIIFSISVAQYAGMSSINWQVTEEQVLYTINKMTDNDNTTTQG